MYEKAFRSSAEENSKKSFVGLKKGRIFAPAFDKGTALERKAARKREDIEFLRL